MADKQFHWGLIGPGRIAHNFAGGLQAIEDGQLYAVASSKLERAQEFAKRYQAPRHYDSYKALADDPRVDAIYIATPHRFHYENTLLCLEAGKPVLCEKPLTVNAAETKKLYETARRNKIFLMEALWTPYLPIWQQVRQWIDEGKIGTLELANATFGNKLARDVKDRWFNPELAGGALLDMGIYPLAMSRFIFGENPASFTAHGRLGPTGVDEFTAVTLVYESGAVAQLSTNFISTNTNDYTIHGSAGYIRIHPMFWAAETATLVTADGEFTTSRPHRASGFEYETEEAMRCIRQGLMESPLVSHEFTYSIMELMDGIRSEIGLKYPFE
ncbi:MAG: Gfo/Idh/MocA family oxidoreductase [Anaerolineales bacterium]|nr:Gfo/Idh/MocA family oxidoreductase [Anaerolineales bacterium]